MNLKGLFEALKPEPTTIGTQLISEGKFIDVYLTDGKLEIYENRIKVLELDENSTWNLTQFLCKTQPQ